MALNAAFMMYFLVLVLTRATQYAGPYSVSEVVGKTSVVRVLEKSFRTFSIRLEQAERPYLNLIVAGGQNILCRVRGEADEVRLLWWMR